MMEVALPEKHTAEYIACLPRFIPSSILSAASTCRGTTASVMYYFFLIMFLVLQ